MPRVVIRVQCPHCGAERNTTSVRTIKCFRCGKSFAVVPKNKKSRIVKLVRGSIQDLHKLILEARR